MLVLLMPMIFGKKKIRTTNEIYEKKNYLISHTNYETIE